MPPEQRRVNAEELQRLFNEAGYYNRTQTGEFSEEVVYEGRPRKEANQPTGTRSERVNYVDHNGRYVATVHQYRKPDGTLGASGLPDPKRVRIGNVVYILDESGIKSE